MSTSCTGLVWEEYPGVGGDFKLALALADGADEDGFVYIEATLRLLHQARLTEASFTRALAQITAKGWLTEIEPQECLFQLRRPAKNVREPKPTLSLVR